MITIIKNDWKRLMSERARLILAIFLVLIIIPLVFWFNDHGSSTLKIEINKKVPIEELQLKEINYKVVNETPKKSELVSGKIDAYVYEKDGMLHVLTNKNKDFENQLLKRLQSKADESVSLKSSEEKQISSFKVVAFFTLFIGMIFSFFISVDKEKNILNRLFTTKLTIIQYITGHFIFIFIINLMLVLLGLFASVLFMGNISSLNGSSLLLLVSLSSLISASNAIFFSAWFETGDSGMMFGQFSIIILSLLSGAFYPFESGSKIVDGFLYLLPTRQVNLLIEELYLTQQYLMPASLICLLSLVLLVSSFQPLRKYGGIIN